MVQIPATQLSTALRPSRDPTAAKKRTGISAARLANIDSGALALRLGLDVAKRRATETLPY